MLNSKFDLYKNEWLDLVFTDRNKSYGAYDLRAHYGDNMMKALAITLTGFTIAAISLTIAFRHDIVPKDQLFNVIPDIPIAPPKFEKPKNDKPIEVDPQVAKPNKSAAHPTTTAPMQRVLPPVVAPDNTPTVEPKAIDPGMAIGPIDSKGDGKQVTNVDGPVTAPGSGPGGSGEADAGTKIFEGVEVMPEPVGGAAAWSKFLQRNLRYPDTEVEGRVILSFVVEKDGHLTDIQVVKGVLSELDREALRVLKLAPAWKPGKQNGQPVRVKYTIPIVFMLNQ